MPDETRFRVLEGGGNVVPVRVRDNDYPSDMAGLVVFLKDWATSIEAQIKVEPDHARQTVSMVAVTESGNDLFRHHYNGGGLDTVGALTWAAGRYSRDMDG